MTCSEKIAVFFTALMGDLGASFVLFGFVAPLEKAYALTGAAGIALKLLLFPLYAFDALAGESASLSEAVFMTLYIGAFVFSGSSVGEHHYWSSFIMAQSARMTRSNQSLEPTAGRCEVHI